MADVLSLCVQFILPLRIRAQRSFSIFIAVLTALLLLGMPESPVYLLSKGRDGEAREALQWLRGKGYDIEGEILQGWLYFNSDANHNCMYHICY